MKWKAEFFEPHADCGHGPGENVESDDMSIENFPGLNDMNFESDFFSIRTIPLHFEVEKRRSLQILVHVYYLLVATYQSVVLWNPSTDSFSMPPQDDSLYTVMQNCPSPTAHEEIAFDSSSISQASVICPSMSSAKSVKVIKSSCLYYTMFCTISYATSPQISQARRRLSENFQTLGLPATTDCNIEEKFLRFEV